MMLSVSFVLLVAALVVFILAAIGVNAPRVNLLALGLALWVAAQLTRLAL